SSPTTSGWPHRLAGFLFKGIQQLVQPAQSLFLKSDCLLGWRQVQSAIYMVRISCTLPELLTGIFHRLGRFLDKSPENLCLRQLLFSKVGGLDAQFLFRVTQTQRAINQTLAPGFLLENRFLNAGRFGYQCFLSLLEALDFFGGFG